MEGGKYAGNDAARKATGLRNSRSAFGDIKAYRRSKLRLGDSAPWCHVPLQGFLQGFLQPTGLKVEEGIGMRGNLWDAGPRMPGEIEMTHEYCGTSTKRRRWDEVGSREKRGDIARGYCAGAQTETHGGHGA